MYIIYYGEIFRFGVKLTVKSIFQNYGVSSINHPIKFLIAGTLLPYQQQQNTLQVVNHYFSTKTLYPTWQMQLKLSPHLCKGI
jgi:hypothetical protein